MKFWKIQKFGPNQRFFLEANRNTVIQNLGDIKRTALGTTTTYAIVAWFVSTPQILRGDFLTRALGDIFQCPVAGTSLIPYPWQFEICLARFPGSKLILIMATSAAVQ